MQVQAVRSVLRRIACSGPLKRSFSSEGYQNIKAVVARSADTPWTVEDVKLRLPRHDEVSVRVVATGVCHTDIVVKQGGLCDFPAVLGHEGAGVVESVGTSVTGVEVGDHVVMSYAACGSCNSCHKGKPAYCYDHGSLNFAGSHPDGSKNHKDANDEELFGSFFQQSSFASHVVTPVNNVIKVDKGLDLASLAPLGCGVQTGAGAVINSFEADVGDTIAVFGCGGVGLSAIMAAKASGCSHIIAVDLNRNRLNLALQLGATAVVDVQEDTDGKEIVAEIQALVGDLGVDYALDTSGNKHVLKTAVDSLKPMGVAALVAPGPGGQTVDVDMLGLLPGKQLRGIIQGDAIPPLFIPKMIELNQKGLFPFEKLITYYDGLESLNEAVEDSSKPDSAVIKPVIRVSKQ